LIALALATVNVGLVVNSTTGTSVVQTPSSPEVAWIRQVGTSSEDYVNGMSAFGSSVFIAGSTLGTLRAQTASGGFDAFLGRYDSAGNEVWTRQFGTSGDDVAGTVFADSSGVYVAGEENGIFPYYSSNGFISKFSDDGRVLWTQQFGNAADGATFAAGITADGTGVYVVGRTISGVAGQTKIAFYGDAYIIKYSFDGTQLWASEFGDMPGNGSTGVSFDSTGVYVSGFTLGTLPGQSSNVNLANGFVRKYDVNGNEKWTRQFNLADYTYANSVSSGGPAVYVAGYTGSGGAFVSSYTPEGDLFWADQFGDSGDSAKSVFAGSTGVFVAGDTYGNFGNQQNFGMIDVFLQKFDFQGDAEWIVHMGTPDFDFASSVAVGGTGGIYLAGSTLGVFPGQNGLGSYDAFVVKLSEAVEQVSASMFFTDANQNPLPIDSQGNPKVDAVLSNGIVRATNPGEVLSWENITNSGGPSLQSIRLNETLPVDWMVHPAWQPSHAAIHVYFVYANGTKVDITDPGTITVTLGELSSIALNIPNLNATTAGSLLVSGESILVSVQLSYQLTGTSQLFSSYPRSYSSITDFVAWTQASYSGGQTLAVASGSFSTYCKVVGDVNGDFKVDIIDLALTAYAYGSTPGSPRWNPNADLNNNGSVGVDDLAIVAYYYGTSS